jgi:hypothetical protein
MNLTPTAFGALADGDMDNFKVASTPGGIEAQEAEGQKSFVASENLPKDCPKEQLEALGVVFGDDADDIFVNVKLPEGWRKKATSHSMHTELLDDQGRHRGNIFYKAAFYDRHADMRLIPRFNVLRNYELRDAVQFVVMDCGESIHKTRIQDAESGSEHFWGLVEQIESEAHSFLTKDYPDWENPSAYWD